VSLSPNRRVDAAIRHLATFLVILSAGNCSPSSEPLPTVPLPQRDSAQVGRSHETSKIVEDVSYQFRVGRPTADEIAGARTLEDPCDLAYGQKRFEGQLVRVKGTFTVLETALLLVEQCERLIFPEFDDARTGRLTPDGKRQFEARTDDAINVVLVGRARTGQTESGDRYGELTVYAIESVANR